MLSLQTQFHNWRNKSSVLKTQTGELKESAEAVELDIKQLGELVSKLIIFHSVYIQFFAVSHQSSPVHYFRWT